MEPFGVELAQTKATSVSAGGKLTLDSLDSVTNAPVTVLQFAQRHLPKMAPAACWLAIGAERNLGSERTRL